MNGIDLIEEYLIDLNDLPLMFTVEPLRFGRQTRLTPESESMLHMNTEKKYLGSLTTEDGCTIEAIRISTNDWRTHERRYFDLHHPNSLQDIAEYIKTWTA